MQRSVTLSLLAALLTIACSNEPPPTSGDPAPPDAAPSPDAAPDVSAPDVATPDVSAPDVATPDVSAPDVAAPDVPRPDAAPDVAAPDVLRPDTTAPDATAPDATAPDAAPDVAPPDARVGCVNNSDCPGQVCCSGMCVRVGDDPRNCGACGRACPAPTGLTGTCFAGTCGAPRCAGGRNNCDGNLANGCESDPATDPANCGGCGVACRPGQTCTAGACVGTPDCPSGTARCGAACVSLSGDSNNCGSCGVVCGFGTRCAASACAPCAPETSFNDSFDRADGALGDTCYRSPPGATFAVVRGRRACATAAAGGGAAARAVSTTSGAVTVGFDFVYADANAAGAVVYSGASATDVVFAGVERAATAFRLVVSTPAGPLGAPVPFLGAPGALYHLEATFSAVTGAVSVRAYPATSPASATAARATLTALRFDRAGFTLTGGEAACVDTFTVSTSPCAPGLASCSGACVDTASSPAHCGGCGVACAPPAGGTAACTAGACVRACPAGHALNGAVCENVTASLSGLRWELPCRSPRGSTWCTTSAPAPQVATLGGSPTRLYDVRLRFRGVVELKGYAGGAADGLWYVGGSPMSNAYNIYSLTTSAPARTYYLNGGAQGDVCVGIDYERTVRMQGGGRVTLTASTGTDAAQVSNHNASGAPIIVPGVAPAPADFDGQFVQMDVVSVTLVP